MRGDVLWPLLWGSALTLATTLVTQWFSLTFQTMRQQEARRADFQRTTLLELRELLGELSSMVSRAMATRRRLADEFEPSSQNPDEWAAFLTASHPDITALRNLAHQLRLVGCAVDYKPLRDQIDMLSEVALAAPFMASDQKAQHAWMSAGTMLDEAITRVGEQLRKLP